MNALLWIWGTAASSLYLLTVHWVLLHSFGDYCAVFHSMDNPCVEVCHSALVFLLERETSGQQTGSGLFPSLWVIRKRSRVAVCCACLFRTKRHFKAHPDIYTHIYFEHIFHHCRTHLHVWVKQLFIYTIQCVWLSWAPSPACLKGARGTEPSSSLNPVWSALLTNTWCDVFKSTILNIWHVIPSRSRTPFWLISPRSRPPFSLCLPLTHTLALCRLLIQYVSWLQCSG